MPVTVFLASTYADLSRERNAILEGFQRLQIERESMEFFGAHAEQPIETCLAEVRKSDVLVIVVGHRYGAMVPEREISFTEAEYTEAVKLGKECLVYMRDEDAPITARDVEDDPGKMILLQRWREALKRQHTIAAFVSAQDLAIRVTADLSRVLERKRIDQLHARQQRTEENVEALQAAVKALVTKYEYKHLAGLASDDVKYNVDPSEHMVRELERLDSIEFVQPVKPKGLNAIREEHGAGDAFNLKDFVKITTEGRAYLDIRDAVLNARAGATTAGA